MTELTAEQARALMPDCDLEGSEELLAQDVFAQIARNAQNGRRNTYFSVDVDEFVSLYNVRNAEQIREVSNRVKERLEENGFECVLHNWLAPFGSKPLVEVELVVSW